MLGWLDHAETGGGAAAHALMRDLAARLSASGVAVRGALQTSETAADDCHCEMTLHILGDDGPDVVISQDLGAEARGCRLDSGALELAAQRVLDTLPDAELLILNKFGKQEIFGRGMVAVIAAAMDRDLPVLISVAPQQKAEFAEFAGELATKVKPGDLAAWAARATQPRAA
ncbi:DUF2478 domain-containing protein [Paracoccus sediminicola]|uniref:DUF2478 domain-containing protein n=1 Tax=Paracoccus sediminicola TaxID=3017783 RepID=UPI0022F0F6B8|nr:DUF2478 domain-containing protein [Paracoccus sediminicola]WBU56753.1 DUF2478 domain-containing protein [Paracoccus sediminicola]